MINGYYDKQEQTITYGFMHLKAEEEEEQEQQQQQQKFGVCRYVCRLTNVIFLTYDDIYTHRELYCQTTDLYAYTMCQGVVKTKLGNFILVVIPHMQTLSLSGWLSRAFLLLKCAEVISLQAADVGGRLTYC